MGAIRALLLLAALVIAPAVEARPLSADEKAGLQRTVDSFNAAMTDKKYDAVADTIPPKVFKEIATSAGMDEASLRKAMLDQMSALMNQVKITSFGMDVPAAIEKEAGNGEPYVLIPTVTEMDVGGSVTVAKSNTLGLLDTGKWYLLRVEDAAQVSILRKVYPEFAGAEFPSGSVEAK